MKVIKIKNTLIASAVALVLALGTISCESLLEEEPLTQIGSDFFYKTEADALSALTGAYARLKSDNGYYRQLWLSNIFAASDQGTSSWRHGSFRNGTISDTDPNLNRPWIDIYAAIREANNVISKVPKIENMDPDLQKRVEGEARFLRGLHYFNLVRAYGEVPLRTEPLKPGEYEGLPVSSVVDIYNQIIFDLDFASKNCWGKEETRNGYLNNLGRVTNVAADAMLTKVYLRIASSKRSAQSGPELNVNQNYLDFPLGVDYYYQKAKDYADQVIDAPGFQLTTNLSDFVSIFDADNGNNPEMILDVQGSSLTEQGTALSNLFSPRQAGLSGGGWGGVNKMLGSFTSNSVDTSDPRFMNTIIHEYQDESRSYTLNPNTTGYFRTEISTGDSKGTLFQVFTAKYIDRSATTEYTSQQNWHIIRLADVHLMRAEALAELSGNPALANNDINILRQRVGMSDFDGTGLSMEDFRTALLRERAVELYAEGHRFFDLTRMGVYEQYCVITHNPTRGQREPQDYTWPIPLIESSANSNIGG